MIPARDWEHIPPRTIIPGFQARFIHSAHMTFALWDIEAGAALPAHSHMHEQVTQVQEGEFELTVDGVTTKLERGMTMVIPPNVPHSGRALTTCKVLDVFWPVRLDYMEGEEASRYFPAPDGRHPC
jgi:quercetin dioxygenase-like cupin family protein